MSDDHDPRLGPIRPDRPLSLEPGGIPRGRGPSGGLLFFRWLLRSAFFVSIALNALLLLMLASLGTDGNGTLHERAYSGGSTSADKVAVIHIDGMIIEGMLGYARKQIDQASSDNSVKAVVLRINSPGGTVTASDSLYHQLLKLRNGDSSKGNQSKYLVVSMGSLAASGGYYVAMPAHLLIAERTTITGSIGVFAAFPNVSRLAERMGVQMDVVKAGEIKDSGSMFKEMTPQERQLWQDMVDHAYAEFLDVVEQGRPALQGKMRDVVVERTIPAAAASSPLKTGMAPTAPAALKYLRRRADGGIFTADQAKAFGLIDQIGYLEDALATAKHLANLHENCRVITYDRPSSFWGSLLGIPRLERVGMAVDPAWLSDGACPRLWYLASQSEIAGLLAGFGTKIPD